MRLMAIAFLGAVAALAQSVPRLDVRKIYIDKMDNNLDQYLRSAISKKFHNTLSIVLKREEAEAVLSGSNLAAQQTQNATVTLRM
jgi:hypothetical protein